MKDFNFKKLIAPAVIFLIIIGVTFGVSNYLGKPDEATQIVDENSSLIESVTPESDAETDLSEFQINGTASSTKDKVTINGQSIPVDGDRNFAAEVALNDGPNELVVEATNGRKKDEKRLVITKTVPNPVEVQKEEKAIAGASKPVMSGTELSTTGPRENAALALTALLILGYFWMKSKRQRRMKYSS